MNYSVSLKSIFSFTVLLLVTCILCVQFRYVSSYDFDPNSAPRLLTWDGRALQELRNELAVPNARLRLSVSTSLAHIKKYCDEFQKKMDIGLVPLVVNKTSWPTDATANHYVSYVPYAHACTELPKDCVGYKGRPVDNSDCDPDTKLPWRICDDRLNIRARDLYTDRPRLEHMMHAVMRLALSAYLFRDRSYSDSAVRLLNAWFVSNQTRMLPTLRYAQGVPGVVDGKPSGCIDLSMFGRGFADSVTLLLQTPETSWADSDISIFKNWCTDMLLEMLNHPRVSTESRMRNNHGLYYDLTVLSLSSLSGVHSRPAQISKMLNPECKGYKFCVHGRLEDQADEEGVQVHESRRPGYGHYVWYTLLAHVHLYTMARSQGYKEPLQETSPMIRIVGWTTRHWNNITGHGEEWQVYGVQAYQIIARMQPGIELSPEICEMLHQMWKRFRTRGVWHENRIGMDVWNLVYPLTNGSECSVWAKFEKLSGTFVSKHIGRVSNRNQESRSKRSMSTFLVDREMLFESARHTQWMTLFSILVWSVTTAFFLALRNFSVTRKKTRSLKSAHWWPVRSLNPKKLETNCTKRRNTRLISEPR